MDSNTFFNILLNSLAHKSYLTFKKKKKDFLPLDTVILSEKVIWNGEKGETSNVPLQLKFIFK